MKNNSNLEIAREYPPVEEEAYVAQMVADMQAQLKKLYPVDGTTLRQAHPKMHGCVKAEFIVLDGLDKELRVGVFREPKTFDAYIRFSNADTNVKKHDGKKDVRGMSIKLTNVPGEKLHNNPANTDSQDFLLISNETFMSKNVKEFHNVIKAVTGPKISALFFMLNPMHFSIVRGIMQSFKKCDQILNTGFWSTTPYLFGKDRAVKYQALPSANVPGLASEDENYLRTNMAKTLSEQDAFFDFFVQFQTDPHRMPIEDATAKWDSPFIKVAKIRIPVQKFDTEEQDHLGNGFSFSPWHSLPEHRPLGGLNRARRKIYEAMSSFWHDRNSQYSSQTIK